MIEEFLFVCSIEWSHGLGIIEKSSSPSPKASYFDCEFNETMVTRVTCCASAGMEFLNHAVHSAAIYMKQFTFHFIAREPIKNALSHNIAIFTRMETFSTRR